MAKEIRKEIFINYTYGDYSIDPFQTTTATQVTADSIAVKASQQVAITVTAIGNTTTFSSGTWITAQATFLRGSTGNITRSSGTTAAGLITSILGNFGLTGPSIDLVANTTTQAIDIKLTGVAATTINWSILVELKFTN